MKSETTGILPPPRTNVGSAPKPIRSASEASRAARLSIGLPDAAALHELTVEVLKSLGSYQMSYRAAARYPKRDRLALLRARTLVASARSDALHRYLDEMHSLVAGSQLLSLAELESGAGLDEAAIAYTRFLDAP